MRRSVRTKRKGAGRGSVGVPRPVMGRTRNCGAGLHTGAGRSASRSTLDRPALGRTISLPGSYCGERHMSTPLRGTTRPGVLAVIALTLWSCGSQSATSPTPPSSPSNQLPHFESLVGTNWIGTARFSSTGGENPSLPVSLTFSWPCSDRFSQCYPPYYPYGLGTTDGIVTRVLGYSSGIRSLTIGEKPVLGSGNWESARRTSDGRNLVIVSSDFSWGTRRGVTFELTRVAWPPDVACPALVSCAF